MVTLTRSPSDSRSCRRHRIKRLLPLSSAVTVALLLLSSIPESSAYHTRIVFLAKPPFVGARDLHGVRYTSSGCGTSHSVLQKPAFNASTGIAKWESSATVHDCKYMGVVSQFVWDGATDINFTVPVNDSNSVDTVHWSVSGGFYYNLTRNWTPKGGLLATFEIGITMLVYEAASGKVAGGCKGHSFSGGVTNGTGRLNFTWNNTMVCRGLTLHVGHTYVFRSALDSQVRAGSWFSPGSLAVATLDLYSGSYGAKLGPLSIRE